MEEDNHVNLMALGGLYAEMYQRQFQIGPMWEEEMGERDM